jgi:hypothetical protein
MYQWSSNSVAIAGATNSSYTLNTGNTSSAGASTYHCVVTNNFGSATGTFSVTVLASPTAPYSQSVLASQPVAYFRLAEPDNGSGNNGVTAYDNAGGYNGSYTNAVLSQPGYSTTDPSDTAALFGQLTGSDSYAGNVPSYLSFAQPSGHNAEFSVEAWFISQFSPQPGFESGLVTIGYGNGGEQFSIDFGANQTTFPLRFYLRDASGTAHGINTSFVPHGDGKWHHVVAVCDEAGGHLYVYIDGFLNSSITIAAGAGLFGWTTPLTIGSRLTSQTSAYANQFFGDVDQVALYNYALSAAQVQAHYLSAGIAPVITSIQPSTLTTNQGSTASFTVAAAGTAPLFYQWSDPTSTAIPNATNATLVLNNVQPGQAGTYTVTVTNVYGSANTNATLTVVQGPPEITQDLQPTSLTVFAGSPIIYTIVVAGSPPFSYQWYQDGLKVNGATNSSYSFLALLGTHTYFCQVTNIASGGTPTVSSTGTVVGMASTTLNPANYTDKLKITFSGYNRSTALADFPALVRLSTNISGFNYGHFASPTGGDLRFTDSSGTRVIPSEIDQWNPNGESVVWVQMPRLSSTNDSIWAYWGNPGATTPPPGTNVWIPQPWEGLPAFDMVYHLKESGFPYADSTGQYAASAGIAPTPSTGLVGLGQTFASAAHLDAGSVNLGNTLSNAFTLSAWVNLSPTANSIQTVWANGPGGFTSAGFRFYVNNWNTANGAVVLEVANGSAGSQVNTSGGLVGANQWHMVAATLDHDNGVAQLYVDGVAQVSGTVRNDFPTNNPDLALANLANNDNAFPLNGMMDEARVQSGVSSPDWIWASYQTVAANGSLQSYGGVNSSVVTMKFHVSGGNIILSGVGPAGMSYDLLSSTNLSSQTATWPSIASGTFDSQGNFSVTNPISSNKKSQFFRLRVP